MPNDTRRRALLDAAIDVLAEAGSRGLTFRRVDEVAAVPPGTTSNYFSSRDDLLGQIGRHIHRRLSPDAATIDVVAESAPTRTLDTQLMRQVLERVAADRAAYIALLELRLEATRRPQLRATLTKIVSADLEANVSFHLDAGFPGDRSTVIVLYLAMSGLLLEHLTLPDLLAATDQLTEQIVNTIVPAS